MRPGLRIRRDALFVSSVLFSIALLLPMPAMLENAGTWRRSTFQVTDQVSVQNYLAPVGFASLASIVIGLIVTWTGYIKRVRWTWFVMFTIVWIWAFPVLLLPFLQHWENMAPITEWLPAALRQAGPQRAFAEAILTFLLMVIALLLPIQSFFRRQATTATKEDT